jgi:hypothetical protein
VPTKDPSREAHFPLIEKKYGEPMKYWFKVVASIKDEKYPVQIAHLRENYGFSQALLEPIEPFKTGTAPWKSKCLRCGSIVNGRYSNLVKGQGGCRTCAANKRKK